MRRVLRLASCIILAAGSAAAVAAPSPSAAITTPVVSASPADLAAQFEKSPDTIVADVNGAPITLGMIADRLHELPEKFAILPSQLIYKAALDDLIQQHALAVKAKELGLDTGPVSQRHLAEATDRELAQALVRKVAPEMVTDKVIEDRYNAMVAPNAGPEEVRFQVIATATEPDAREALDLLSRGTDFAAVARQISKDPSASSGGEIGYARRDRLTPEIGAVVFAMLPGQTTAFPVFSNNMWFIIRVEGRRQQGTPTLAEAKPALTAELNREALVEIARATRAAVVVNDYGPTGMRGSSKTP